MRHRPCTARGHVCGRGWIALGVPRAVRLRNTPISDVPVLGGGTLFAFLFAQLTVRCWGSPPYRSPPLPHMRLWE